MSKSNVKKMSPNKRAFILVGVVLFVIVTVDLTPLGGNIRYYHKINQCGNTPYITHFSFRTNRLYYQKDTSKFEILRGFKTYYCSPLEAEKAGGSFSEYEVSYPAIDEYNKNNPYTQIEYPAYKF